MVDSEKSFSTTTVVGFETCSRPLFSVWIERQIEHRSTAPHQPLTSLTFSVPSNRCSSACISHILCTSQNSALGSADANRFVPLVLFLNLSPSEVQFGECPFFASLWCFLLNLHYSVTNFRNPLWIPLVSAYGFSDRVD